MLVRTEGSLDAFANDFLTYLCGGFHIGNRWRIKVITCNDKNWAITIPRPIRDRLSKNYQEEGHPVVLVYDLAEDSKVSEEYHRFCMRVVGFSRDQVDALNQYDALIILNGDHLIPQREEPPLLPQLAVIAHMTLHFIEFILHRQIIREREYTHNYEDHNARALLHEFVEDSGIEEFTNRYC
jgi:hypothetical protein